MKSWLVRKVATDAVPWLAGLSRGATASGNSYAAVRANKSGAGSASFDVPVDLWGPFADQATPDVDTATDFFASAGTHLDAAATGAGSLTSKEGKKAKKKIASADKALGKSAVAFNAQKSVKGVKAYGKGVKDVLAALDLLLPDFEL